MSGSGLGGMALGLAQAGDGLDQRGEADDERDLGQGSFVDRLIDYVEQRAARVTYGQERAEQVCSELRHRLERWFRRRQAVTTGHLGYQVSTEATGLLRDPDEGTWDLWSAPLSLREVETEILLQLDRDDHSLGEAPAWSYERTSAGGEA